jgi:hypothetical protein
MKRQEELVWVPDRDRRLGIDPLMTWTVAEPGGRRAVAQGECSEPWGKEAHHLVVSAFSQNPERVTGGTQRYPPTAACSRWPAPVGKDLMAFLFQGYDG